MYVRGSEGPPATPMRVLWDVIDSANARITIDFGEKYEPALAKLGFGAGAQIRRQAGQEGAVRGARRRIHAAGEVHLHVSGAGAADGELRARRVGAAAGREGRGRRAADHTAQPRLEVAALLHVTYLAPQKSGPPKAQDLIKGDMVFVGQPEAASPEAAGRSNKP